MTSDRDERTSGDHDGYLRHGSATALLDARYGALGVRAADGGLSEFVYVGIDPAQREVMGHLPEGRGILGLLINDPRPVRLGDLSKHPASIGFPPNHPPMKSFLGTPIMVRGKVFGSIYLTEKLGAPEFTEEDEVILKVLAMSAGVAVENRVGMATSAIPQPHAMVRATAGQQPAVWMPAESQNQPSMPAQHRAFLELLPP